MIPQTLIHKLSFTSLGKTQHESVNFSYLWDIFFKNGDTSSWHLRDPINFLFKSAYNFDFSDKHSDLREKPSKNLTLDQKTVSILILIRNLNVERQIWTCSSFFSLLGEYVLADPLM